MILLNEKLKASDFFFLDKDFNQMFPLRNYINFSWHPTFNESFGGDFEIEFDISTNEKERLTRLIEVGYHIASLPNQKIGVVTSIEESKFKDGERTLIVSGIMMDGLLQNRYAPSNVMDSIIQHGSVIDYSLMLMMVAADWDRYNAIMKTRPYAKHYNKNNYAETLGWGNGSWMANKLNMVNFPVYVDFHMADTSFSYGTLDTTSLDSQSSNIGALVSKYTRENTTGTGVFPLFKERDYLYNDTNKEKPIQLLKEGAYDKENITMFVYNGKDLSDSIIFTDQNGSLDRLIKLNTNKQVENNTMFQYSYKSRGPNRYEDGRVNYDTLDIKDSFLIPSSAFVDGKDNILVKEVLDAKTFSENSGDLEYKKISQENQQFFESNYNLNSEINNSIEANISEFYEASLNTNIFAPGRDFTLGDFVTVESQEMGVSSIMLVSGLIYFFDSNGQESVEVELEDYSKFDNHNLILDVKYEDSRRGAEGVKYGIFKGNTLVEEVVINSAGMAYAAKDLPEGTYTTKIIDDKGLVFKAKPSGNITFNVRGSRRPSRIAVVIEDYQMKITCSTNNIWADFDFFFGEVSKSGSYLRQTGVYKIKQNKSFDSTPFYNFRFLSSLVNYELQMKDSFNNDSLSGIQSYNYMASRRVITSKSTRFYTANFVPTSSSYLNLDLNITNSSLFNSQDSLDAPLMFSVPGDIVINKSTGKEYLFDILEEINKQTAPLNLKTKNKIEIKNIRAHTLRYIDSITYDLNYKSGDLTSDATVVRADLSYANMFGSNNTSSNKFITILDTTPVSHWQSFGKKYIGMDKVDEVIDIPTIESAPEMAYSAISPRKIETIGEHPDMKYYLTPIAKPLSNDAGMVYVDIPEEAELLRTEVGTLDPLNITKTVRLVEYNARSEKFNSYRNFQYEMADSRNSNTYAPVGFWVYSNFKSKWYNLGYRVFEATVFQSINIFDDKPINIWVEKIKDVKFVVRDDLILSDIQIGGAYQTPVFTPWWKPGETPSL